MRNYPVRRRDSWERSGAVRILLSDAQNSKFRSSCSFFLRDTRQTAFGRVPALSCLQGVSAKLCFQSQSERSEQNQCCINHIYSLNNNAFLCARPPLAPTSAVWEALTSSMMASSFLIVMVALQTQFSGRVLSPWNISWVTRVSHLK